MTAPAARIAEIVAEGRRLEETVQSAIDLRMPTLADELISRRNEFRAEHWPALLAVADAAVEWEAADEEQRRVPAWSRDTDLLERMLFRSQSATRALRAAVRGEEKTP